MSKLQTVQGATGLLLKLYTTSDMSGFVSGHLRVTRPDGAQAEWPLTLEPSDDPNYAHLLTYTTNAGDLDQAGAYVLELWVDLGTFQGYADEPVLLYVRELGVA